MTNPSFRTPTAQELLQHMEFVRTLALALVDDASVADDVAQETLIDALRKPPQLERGLRAWFGGVVRNKIRLHYRGEGRRQRWERKAGEAREQRARNDALAEDALQRAELRQQVVQTVIDLPEPYRLTLILRYLEDLTPTEIAEWTGEPLSTVKTRLQRGMERVRRRLDEDHGDRKSWKKALVLLASPEALRSTALAATSPTATSAATGVGISMGWLLMVIVLALGGWAVSSTNLFEDKDPTPEASTVAANLPSNEHKQPADESLGSSTSTNLALPTGEASSSSNGVGGLAVLAGQLRIIDGDGAPVVGAAVTLGRSELELTTGKEGRVSFDHRATQPELAKVRHPAYVSQTMFLCGEGPFEMTLVEGEPLVLRVVDSRDGQPISDAEVQVCFSCPAVAPQEGDTEPTVQTMESETAGATTSAVSLGNGLIEISGTADENGEVEVLSPDRIEEILGNLPEDLTVAEIEEALTEALGTSFPFSVDTDGVGIEASGVDLPVASSFETYQTDEFGEASLRVPSDATTQVWIRAPGYTEVVRCIENPRRLEGDAFLVELALGSRLTLTRNPKDREESVSVSLCGPLARSDRFEPGEDQIEFDSLSPGRYQLVAFEGNWSDYMHSPYAHSGSHDWIRQRQGSARGTDLLARLSGRIRTRIVDIGDDPEYRLSIEDGQDVEVQLVGLDRSQDSRPTVALYSWGQLASVASWKGSSLWLESVVPGNYQLEVRDRGVLMRSRPCVIQASTSSVEVDVRGASLAIPADVRPDESVVERVAVVSTSGGSMSGHDRPAGEPLAIEGLEPGPVEVWRLRGRVYLRNRLLLRAGKNELDQDQPEENRTIRLSIRDAWGQPSRAKVWLVPSIAAGTNDPIRAMEVWLSRAPSVADASNLHEWDLPEGRYHVGFETDGDLAHHEVIEVTRDQTFDIRIPKMQSLTIRLHERGQPVVAQDLCVSRLDVPPIAGIQPCIHVQTDTAGLATLDLPQGEYAVQLPSHRPARFELEPGLSTYEIDLGASRQFRTGESR